MVLRIAKLLQVLFADVIVAGGNVEAIQAFGLNCFPDPIPERGALGGLYTGLIHSESERIFLCACDMPLLNANVIQIILAEKGTESITLPVIDSIRQPLHAVYKKDILAQVETLLGAPDFHLPMLFGKTSVCFLEEKQFAHIPDYQLSFVNFNDPETAKKYLPLLERGQR